MMASFAIYMNINLTFSIISNKYIAYSLKKVCMYVIILLSSKVALLYSKRMSPFEIDSFSEFGFY